MTQDVRPQQFVPQRDEGDIFAAAFIQEMAVMLIGPTGCGKTTFVEEMAHRLGRPLVTVTCHDDLTTADLVGRFLVNDGDVEWHDGPLTTAMRTGAICYLDEVIEARRDTLALLHSVVDHRRSLFIERRHETVAAASGFMLVGSYNPRSRGSFKELRPSLRQRFVTIAMDYLPRSAEAELVSSLGGVERAVGDRLVNFAGALRSEGAETLMDPPSTRTMIQAARLIAAGVPERRAIETAVVSPLCPDGEIDGAVAALLEVIDGR